MNPADIIAKKRHGGELSTEEISCFTRGACDGSFKEYQLAALLMAICIRGMSERETVDLTMAMARSGDMLDLSAVEGSKVDKHSTGGVGDTTTLILAPLVAACGAKVAKMSGRGLGHTGGTLDKLEAIPGFTVGLSGDQFIRQLNRVGLAVIGQSENLTPADKALYALRDVTATVDSLPLVVSSILSKKIAGGSDAVVLDVKAGSGAIMPTLEQSIELAEWMVRIGRMTGRRFRAVVTDMDQPLGLYIGNALEVKEAISVLAGERSGPLREVSLLLGAHMLLSAEIVRHEKDALVLLERKLQSGEGLIKLGEMIEAQGGDRRVTEDVSRLPGAADVITVPCAHDGFVSGMRTGTIGNAAKALGAGRSRKEDRIDPAAGIVMKKRIGDAVARGETLYELHTGVRSDTESALRLMAQAIDISAERVTPPPLVHKVIA